MFKQTSFKPWLPIVELALGGTLVFIGLNAYRCSAPSGPSEGTSKQVSESPKVVSIPYSQLQPQIKPPTVIRTPYSQFKPQAKPPTIISTPYSQLTAQTKPPKVVSIPYSQLQPQPTKPPKVISIPYSQLPHKKVP